MNSMSLLKDLMSLRKQFELGCEILITDESIVIKGYDYHPDKEHFAVERTYEAEIQYDEEGDLIDTMSSVFTEISKDAC